MGFARFAMLAGQMLIGTGAVIPGPLLEVASTNDAIRMEQLTSEDVAAEAESQDGSSGIR